MSLMPKIAEVFKFTVRNKVDLACINETWLKDRIVDSVEEIPSYSIIRRDREVVEHGGVCLNIKDRYSKYRLIDELKKNTKFYGSIRGQSDSPEGTPA